MIPKNLVRAVILIALSGLTSVAAAADAPILRVETSLHSSRINRIAADPAGRYLVTISEDKTARLWSPDDGRLLSVMRVPSDADEIGRLSAVALSPDGEEIAIAGATRLPGQSTPNGYRIHVVARSSGEILRQLSGLKTHIHALAWSPDGRRLAVGYIEQGGVAIVDSQHGARYWQDTDYRDSVADLAFSQDGQSLFASGRDGFLRRYHTGDNSFHREVKRASPDGNEPWRMALSPDGQSLALGYMDAPRVSVLDTATLLRRFSPLADDIPARRGNDINNLSLVSWSPDGMRLCASGRWRKDRILTLRCWSEGGRGPATDSSIPGDTLTHMGFLPDQRLFYATTSPSMGMLSASGTLQFEQRSPIADFRAGAFRVSHYGTQITFASRPGEARSATSFDVISGAFRPVRDDLQKPSAISPRIRVENWETSERPLLNKIPLQLAPHDASRSVAVSPNEEYVAIGGDHRVYLFDKNGKRVWAAFLNRSSFRVAFSGDGRWLISACSDGIIRWHRIRDGKEALRLLPHPDGERWVMWTPSGYYSASIGGEDMIGWHLNRGANTPDFFPASRFRDTYHRPDIIEAALSVDSEPQAIAHASQARGGPSVAQAEPALDRIAPPVVRILTSGGDGQFNTPQQRVQISIRTQGDAPVTNTLLRINGQPVTARLLSETPASVDGAHIQITRELEFPVPGEDVQISLFAENRHGISTAATRQLTWRGKARQDSDALLKPKLYVLAIGIGQYQQRDLQLQFAAKDARDFVNVLKRQQGQLYREVEVRALIDSQAGRDDILDGLEWLRRQVTHRDVGMLFMAGHGVNDADGTYYFLPHNADPDRLKRTGIIHHEIRNTLAALPGKAVFFVDTCHAGNVLGAGRRTAPHDISAMVNELSSAENGVLVFSASTGRQYSLENASWGNGAFTKALLEGMDGAADYRKTGRVTHKMLDLYVSERVKILTEGKQTPVTIIPQGVPDFPLMTVMPPLGIPARP